MAELLHVIDDDAGLRDALAFLLEVNGVNARFYESGDAFLAALPVEQGCLLTDVRMPGLTGLELVRELKDRGVDLPVIVMTGHGDVPLAVEAMKAGVVDFIEKPFGDDVLLAAVKAAFERLNNDVEPDAARLAAEGRLAQLSPRERDVLAGVVEGKLNKVIAYELEISPRTVEIYRANLMSKTGARNVADLMRIALAAGL
ncbi:MULTISPECIES: response regulator FixJ [unclassified Brevundimonas]|uniref:response regulator FixJ n=1 Tax=unclassified Brevundimonas TaxID=2622653 RepID=UPI0006F3E1C8|nr:MULTISPECIES: response regulator FixJ [unclassified Brevundimonas]KQY93711.1 two-component system response regulator [Brevundimonas sp. Root1423]KRA29005.1 two-component system response regulator [Brevundimonas sp. Root608]